MPNEGKAREDGMSELMKAHLDEVAGGAAHNSWKQIRAVPEDQQGIEAD